MGLPVTATFMLTDIVGSTQRWDDDASEMNRALQQHDAMIASAVAVQRGTVVKHTGDGVLAVFGDAADAALAAVACQFAIAQADWSDDNPLRIRVGIDTGDAEERDGDYFGQAVNRAARLNTLAHAGQVLLSGATRLEIGERTDPDTSLLFLGKVQLKGVTELVEVYQVTAPGLPTEFPALHARRGPPQLPAPTTSMVGREHELDAIFGAVEDHRLVTIVGPGGMGKTRLALEAAHQLQSRFPDAVWWCELAPVSSVADSATSIAASQLDAVSEAIALTLGATDRQGRQVVDAIIDVIGTQRSVIVLDNAEHVVEGVAPLASKLLAGNPSIRILCTSREALDVGGEWVVQLTPLGVGGTGPAEGYGPAVTLFVERAVAANGTFVLTRDNAGVIRELCQRLDGLPLAVEIAAARVRSISPAQILARLDHRFQLLRWDHRDKDDRHQSLEAAIEWSYGMSSESDRALFERLSVFVSTFDLAAAHAVAGVEGHDEVDTIDVMDRLIRRSLVSVVPGDPVRYQVLESLRAFGQTRLEVDGGTTDALRRWADHYVRFAEEANDGLHGPNDALWVQRLHREFANLRSVHVWAVSGGHVDVALRLSAALFDYAFFRLRLELADWTAQALALAGAQEHPLWGDVNGAAANLAWVRGSVGDARRLADVAVGADPSSWFAHQALGTIALFQGDTDRAGREWDTAVAVAARKADAFHELIALAQATFVSHLGGELEAPMLAVEVRDRADQLGNTQATTYAAWLQGLVLSRGDPPRALEEFERSLELARTIDSELSIGSASDLAEQLRVRLADLSRADQAEQIVERVRYWRQVGNPPNQWQAVKDFVRLLSDAGNETGAAIMYGAWHRAELKISTYGSERARLQDLVERLRASLGRDVFAAEVRRGAGLTDEELVVTLERLAAEVRES